MVALRRIGDRLYDTVNLRTKITSFRGFDASVILILRGGILTSIGSFLQMLSQRISIGIVLAARLGVARPAEQKAKFPKRRIG